MHLIPLSLALVLLPFLASAADFPAPKTLGDTASYGRKIQRTMRLLAESTPEKRNTVRVLFYGQSITEQGWWKIVADDLRARFHTRTSSSKTARSAGSRRRCSRGRRRPTWIRSSPTC